MRLLFWLVLRLRLRQKFWGDLYMKWVSRKVRQAVDKIDLDISDIKIISNEK